jgi:hypothetical protein
MPPPVNHPLWTSITKSMAPTPTIMQIVPTPVAQVTQIAHLEPRDDDVQRFIDAMKGNTLIKPKLVQDPDNDIWLSRLPTSPQQIEVRATTAEDLKAREREAVVANIVSQIDRRGDRLQHKLTETSKDSSSLQRHNIKRDDHNTGVESVPCSDPHVSSMWYCNGLGPRDLSIGAELASRRNVLQWTKNESTEDQEKAIIEQAKAYVAYVEKSGTEEELTKAKTDALLLASLSQAREKAALCKEDLAKAGKIIQSQKIAVILLAVFLGVVVCSGLAGLLLVLRRRSKKRAQDRAEGRVIELQVRAGGANGDEAK